MRFRKRPVEIEAVQWTGHNCTEVYDILNVGGSAWRGQFGSLVIPTLEGEVRADPGDWIIRGSKGEFYPCKPAIFEETYEEVIA